MSTNFLKKYKEEAAPALCRALGYKNVLQAPKIKKVALNVGVGRFIKEPNFIENVENTLTRITGQKPVRAKAKKSISNFKIREGMEIGVRVTLRGPRMYHFLEKLVNVTFPRVRDFRGLSDSCFDKQGNYTIGFKEHVAFPEVKSGEVDKIHGLEIVINTTAKTKEEGKLLLVSLGFPFTK